MQAYTRLWLDRDTKSYFTEEVPEIHKSTQWISKSWAETACSSVATRHATQRNSKPQFYNCLPYGRYNDRYIWRYNIMQNYTMQYINLNKGTATPDFTTIFPQIQWIYVKWIQMNTNRNMNTKTNSQMCLQMIVANVCFQCCI